MYLNFLEHRNNRSYDTQKHVEADEELVDEAPFRFGIEDEAEDDSSQ